MLKTEDQARWDWDVGLGRRWAKLLALGFFLPIVFPLDLRFIGGANEIVVVWPWTGMGERSLTDTLYVAIPFLLAVSAWCVLGLRARRLRGGILLALCASAVFVPTEKLFLAEDPGGFTRAASQIGAIVGLLILGCVFVAAGNRQQKRSMGRGPAPILAGLGGVAVVGAFLYPSIPFGRAGQTVAPFAVFLEAEAWAEGWLLLGWLAGVFLFGALATLSFLAERVGYGLAIFVQRWLSRLARLLPIALPCVVIGGYIAKGGPGVVYVVPFAAKTILMLLAVMVLAAIGLARLLDDAAPGTVWVRGGAPEPEDDLENAAA